MTLKIFSDRQWKEFKEIYCWSLRQRFGMMVLYFALLFMALPMILLLVIARAQAAIREGSVNNMGQNFSSALELLLPALVVPLTLLFVLILGVMLYSYMHQKRSVDYFHSLPAGRIPLLLGKYFAGLTMIFVPLILNFSIVAIIIGANDLHTAVRFSSLLYNLLWAMLMVAAAFSFTILMAVCSGTTMDMVISTIVINISYPILIVLCQCLANSILPGLSVGNNYLSVYTVAFAPFAAAFLPFLPFRYSNFALTTSFTVWWILLTLVLFAACLVLYRKRKSESAENNFAFPLPKIIIRFVATAAVGLGFGMAIYSALGNNSSQFNFFLGVFAGSLITHIIAEVIYSRGFKGLKKSFVYYGAFVVLFLVAYLPVSYGFFGYDTRIPATSEVSSVELSWPNCDNTAYVHDNQGNQLAVIEGKIKSSENINIVRTLQKTIVNRYRQNSYPYKININQNNGVQLTYSLKNGRTMTRSYSLNRYGNAEEVLELYSKIQNLEEYKTTANLINYLEPSYISQVDIRSKDKSGSNLEFGDDIKQELLDALKQDIAADTLGANDKQETNDTISIDLQIKTSFIPTKGSPLKKRIGNYNGTISFSYSPYSGGNSNYEYYCNVPKTYTHTMALIHKYGWIK